MRRLVVLAALLAARSASANQCPAYQRHVVTLEVPVGCPLVVYQDHEWYGGTVPTVSIEHAGTYREVTPTATSTESELISIYRESIDENCIEHNGYEQRPWDRLTLDIGTVEVGDVVRLFSGFPDATITAAGPCPTAGLPSEGVLYCQDPVQDYWACEGQDMPQDPADPADPSEDTGYFGGGCNAGAGLGVAALALLGGLRRRRSGQRR